MKKFLAIYIGTEEGLDRAGWNKLSESQRKAREAEGMKAWMAWGEANRMKNSDCSRARSIEGHSPGLAARLVLSRNTRMA